MSQIIAENTNYDFSHAIELVGRRIQDAVREAAIEAAAEKLTEGQTVRQMQKNLEQKLDTQNLTAVEYSNGVQMPLKQYAEMVSRSTTAETQNIAKTAQGKAWGYDLVKMTTHSPTCGVCAMYQGRVYATTKEAGNGKYRLKDGTVLRFPYLYDTAFASGYSTIHPNCRHRISLFAIRAYTDEELRHYSNLSMAPFEDTRSDQERKAYSAAVAKRRKLLENRRQYERIKAALPNDAPKSFAGFMRMKNANSENWQNLMRDYRYISRVAKRQNGGIIETDKINYAKPLDMLNFLDISSQEEITAEMIIEDLQRTEIGRETLMVIENLPEPIKFTYGEYDTGVRGDQEGIEIRIYLNNCKNVLWTSRSVIHEITHYRYGIGQSQWAECVCVAQELKHARGRNQLTYGELRMIVRAVKDAYPNYNWRKGGIIYGRRRSR